MDLKLDTLHKKPKVYHIAVLSTAVLAVLVLLLFFGGERQIRLISLLLAAYFLAMSVLLLRAFFLQIRYNLYSYNTIIYFGFALFTFFIALTCALLFFGIRDLDSENIPPRVFSILLSSAEYYMLVTLPFLLVFSVALVISNISLIRHEGFRAVNVLGMVLAFLILGGEALIFFRDYAVSGSLQEVMYHDILSNSIAAIYLYFECMMIGTMVADAIAARYEPKKNKDYIIVLGCAIRKDGTPTPLLRGRLDRALSFASDQETETGKAPVFVLSGGKGPDEMISEAECMRRYLAEQGVPEERMILEDQSTDTAENMKFSKEKILAQKADAVVAFSTTNYHVFRSGLKARRVKLRAQGMGCRSKWYFWPNAAVREFIGLLTQHRLKQGLILGALIVLYVVMTFFYYHVYG